MNSEPHPSKFEIGVFDKRQSVAMLDRRLPHWSQAGTISFITFRAWDSMPEPVVMRWLEERDAFLMAAGIDPSAANWQAKLGLLSLDKQTEFHKLLSQSWNEQLDTCHGACVLKRPEFSAIVADSLCYFDEQRYLLTDFVVMPNHVHVLVAFDDETAMLAQCESWKHFTATKINRMLGRKGRFWQQDGFDHLVRSVDQFEYLRKYLSDNPVRARLSPGEFRHLSKDLNK